MTRSLLRKRRWSLTLHDPVGSSRSIDIGDSEFVLGAETGAEVFGMTGEGVAARHAWVSIGDGVNQVEDPAEGTLVKGARIEGRVMVDPPVSIQVGSVTIVIEAKNLSPLEQPSTAETQTTDCTGRAAVEIETTIAFTARCR